MKNWDQRSITTASLLNPAFCGEIIRRTIFYYNQNNGSQYPYSLLFLILPLALSHDIRKSMPLTTKKIFHSWVQENERLLFDFAYRVRATKEYTLETILFLLANQTIELSDEGTIKLSRDYRLRYIEDDDIHAEIKDIFKKAELLGKWFRQLTPQTIYMFLKIRP